MQETPTQPTLKAPDNASGLTDKPSTRSRIRRWIAALAWFVFVIATLLAFPSHLTVLSAAIAVVIFGCLAFQQTRQAATVSLIAGAILIVKTPSIQIDFILMVAAFLTSGVAYFLISPKMRWTAFAITVAAVTFFGIKRTLDAQASLEVSLDQRPIICLGDSLTEWKNGGYPAELQKLAAQPVLNFGRNGYTTQMAIDDLLPKILAEKPQLVVMELGGHDYKDGEPRAQTKSRLRQIIQTLTDADIRVVIVEVARGFISDPFYGIERELSAEFDLQLIPDTIIRRFVYFSPIAPPGYWLDSSQHLSEDGLHPNQRGRIEFAKVVAEAIGVGD